MKGNNLFLLVTRYSVLIEYQTYLYCVCIEKKIVVLGWSYWHTHTHTHTFNALTYIDCLFSAVVVRWCNVYIVYVNNAYMRSTIRHSHEFSYHALRMDRPFCRHVPIKKKNAWHQNHAQIYYTSSAAARWRLIHTHRHIIQIDTLHTPVAGAENKSMMWE